MLIRDRSDSSHNHEFIVANVVQIYSRYCDCTACITSTDVRLNLERSCLSYLINCNEAKCLMLIYTMTFREVVQEI